MDIEKLQQELNALHQIDTDQMTPEQLEALVEKLSSLLNHSEQSLLNTTLLEINQQQEEDETDNS